MQSVARRGAENKKVKKDKRRALGLGELALGRFGSFKRVGFWTTINRVSCKKPFILTSLSLSSLPSSLKLSVLSHASSSSPMGPTVVGGGQARWPAVLDGAAAARATLYLFFYVF